MPPAPLETQRLESGLTESDEGVRPLGAIDLVPIKLSKLGRDLIEIGEGLLPRVRLVGDDEVDDGRGNQVAVEGVTTRAGQLG